ncbi:hypothetical protein Arub01_43550 [Actinomadura rubrobrunea]|uniref:SnoaL-like domain-containing protein n=1 Tax=Actinomadura rubrobrunea TaxID=115335 RepID=A0A9W6Q055_9ACTN|nr:nuclear transport factor 2 family protein [Actinomadura rubrobrunea]GLW66111.1 hypothetical protein Arub01_43550 [Actinomadura rubrobrunea]
MDAIVARYHEAMCRKSADALADLYAEDAVHEFPFRAPGFPPRLEGREAIRLTYREKWGASPVVLDRVGDVVTHRTTDPEVVIVEQVATGAVGGPGGPRFAMPGLLVLRIRDGEITHCRDYLDGLALAGLAS